MDTRWASPAEGVARGAWRAVARLGVVALVLGWAAWGGAGTARFAADGGARTLPQTPPQTLASATPPRRETPRIEPGQAPLIAAVRGPSGPKITDPPRPRIADASREAEAPRPQARAGLASDGSRPGPRRDRPPSPLPRGPPLA